YFMRARGRDAELLDERLVRVTLLPGAGTEAGHIIDRSGRLWTIAGSDLVARDTRDGTVSVRIALGLSEAPLHLFLDRDDNLWIGSTTQGLIRVSPSPLRVLRPEGRAQPLQIFAVQQLRDGTVLATAHNGTQWIA